MGVLDCSRLSSLRVPAVLSKKAVTAKALEAAYLFLNLSQNGRLVDTAFLLSTAVIVTVSTV